MVFEPHGEPDMTTPSGKPLLVILPSSPNNYQIINYLKRVLEDEFETHWHWFQGETEFIGLIYSNHKLDDHQKMIVNLIGGQVVEPIEKK